MATYNQHHATQEYSEGNPALPQPGSDKQGRTDINIRMRKPKKLIVLCDGTGQDSSGGTAQNPTNVTRLGRALAPNCWVKKEKGSNTNEQDQAEDDEYEEWEQIVSYYAGVGTFAGNNALGVIFGDGLSEIVRSAYGFLASNWQNGDKIYLIGFSRGAYIARAIAGLVADHGLLTKRSMDNFHAVYETFYMTPERKKGEMPLKVITADGTQRWRTADDAGLRPVPYGTVEAVAVFDTVAFHFNLTSTDKDEGKNTLLSHNVKYAFHALSLDEDRIPFQPSLFFKHRQRKNDDGRQTTLEQVWFSGAHSDIGGGKQDPRLSNIALAWMIDRLESNNLLAFNKVYLTDPPPKSTVSSIATNGPHNSSSPILNETPWSTSQGPNWDVFSMDPTSIRYWFKRPWDIIVHYIFWPLLEFIKFALCIITYPLNPRWSRDLTGRRTPCQYIPVKDNHNLQPKKREDYETCEYLHESIKDRLMPPKKQTNMKWRWPYSRSGHWHWPHAQKEWWPCESLRDWKYVAGGEEGGQGERWVKKSTRGWSGSRSGGNHALDIKKHGAIEGILKGQMRFGRVLRPWCEIVPVPVPEQARPLTSEGESA